MADTKDLKSFGGDIVSVRVRPPPPNENHLLIKEILSADGFLFGNGLVVSRCANC